MLNILLVGGESAGLQALRTIAGTAHRLVGVLVSPSRNGYPGAGILRAAEQLGVPSWPGTRVRAPDFAAFVRDAGVDLLLNVHSLSLIAPAVLDAPRLGCFNLHPGPLPECAGLNTPSWALHQGARTHGVSLHWMTVAIDAGPLAFCERFPIEDTDTGLSLALKCIRFGLPLIEQLLHAAASGSTAIPRIPQDLDRRRYFEAGPPEGGRLSWTASARQVFDFVRAADFRPFQSPWIHPRACINGHELGIVSARRTGRGTSAPPGTVGLVSADGVEIACCDEWLLVREVEDAGRYQPAHLALSSRGGLKSCLT